MPWQWVCCHTDTHSGFIHLGFLSLSDMNGMWLVILNRQVCHSVHTPHRHQLSLGLLSARGIRHQDSAATFCHSLFQLNEFHLLILDYYTLISIANSLSFYSVLLHLWVSFIHKMLPRKKHVPLQSDWVLLLETSRWKQNWFSSVSGDSLKQIKISISFQHCVISKSYCGSNKDRM